MSDFTVNIIHTHTIILFYEIMGAVVHGPLLLVLLLLFWFYTLTLQGLRAHSATTRQQRCIKRKVGQQGDYFKLEWKGLGEIVNFRVTVCSF